ncbi:hypothetical protein [Dorea sp. D27]|uniref:hypothetical protein n=1 Tax=Dorea sp. D27 TaxID=658665 RepID=UPI0006A16CAE|nr:hypothetical protein [Dorea sp. D27]KMZ52352.1 hypothetical protein HMPREF0980_03555 [Dorea sp. D27]
MDKNILIECADMKEEIKDLRSRIDKGRKELDRLNSMVVTDAVSCGKKGKKPLRMVKIQGRPTALITQKNRLLTRRIARLERLELELLELTVQAEEYIEQIGKSELRIMFRLYFIDDLTYPKVAEKMNSMFPRRNIAYTDENVKKRIQRFFENVPQCPEEKGYSLD